MPQIRRALPLSAALLALATTATACVSGNSSDSGDGRLRVDLAFAPTQRMSPYGDDGLLLSRLGVVEGLTRMDTDGKIEPALATSWKQSGKTWTFTLRDAEFQDGTPVTAEAVVRSLEEAAAAKVKPRVLSDVTLKASADGEDTVKVTAEGADGTETAQLPSRLANPSLAILSEQAYAKKGQVDPVGHATGVFTMTKLNGAVSATLERNDTYWGEKAAAPGADVKFVADNAARANALRSGQIDIAEFVPAAQAGQLGDTAKAVPTVRTTGLYLNTDKGVLKDPALRAAVREAVDTKDLAKSVYEGYADQGEGLLGPGVSWVRGKHEPVTGRAKAASGKGRTLTLATYSNRAELPEVATALQEQLKSAGFTVKLVVKDAARLESAALDGEFDAYLMSRSTALDTGDPVPYFASDFTCAGSYNIAQLCDRDVDAAVREAAAASDDDARHQAVLDAEAAILKTDAVVPLVHEEHLQGVADNVEGVVLDPYERQFIGADTRVK